MSLQPIEIVLNEETVEYLGGLLDRYARWFMSSEFHDGVWYDNCANPTMGLFALARAVNRLAAAVEEKE